MYSEESLTVENMAMVDRKTCKIRELLATSALEARYARSTSFQHEEDLRRIVILNYLEAAKKKRSELLKQIDVLTKNLVKADKSIQAQRNLLDFPTMTHNSIHSDEEYDYNEVKEKSEKESELESSRETTDIEALRNDLDTLVTVLSFTLKRLAEYKKCLNTKLSKDMYSKGPIIDYLNAHVEELYLAKDSAERKATILEQHLAQSKVNIEALEQENQILRKEMENLKKEIPNVGDTLDPEGDAGGPRSDINKSGVQSTEFCNL